MALKLPEQLFLRVMSRIERERRLRALRRRLVIFGFGAVFSLVVFIPLFDMARTALAESGFITFFSLIFSDFGTVLALWKDYLYSLLETIPVLEISMLLAAAFIFFGSLRFFFRDIKKFISLPRLIAR